MQNIKIDRVMELFREMLEGLRRLEGRIESLEDRLVNRSGFGLGQSTEEDVGNAQFNGITNLIIEVWEGQRRLENKLLKLEDKTGSDTNEHIRENREEINSRENRVVGNTHDPTSSTTIENASNGFGTKGRIILEGGSRMRNVKTKITKIEDKEVWVYAKGGSNLKDISKRLEYNLSDGDKDSIVVIQGGVNDLYNGDSVKTVCKNMADILLYLRGKVRAVIVSSVIPTLNMGRKHDPMFLYKLRKLNYELLNTVKENGGHYLDLIDSFQKDGCLKREFYRADQLHLNEKGNKLFINILNEWISSFLGERWDEEKRFKGSRLAYPKGERKIKKTGR